jgi:hypothetical protein
VIDRLRALPAALRVLLWIAGAAALTYVYFGLDNLAVSTVVTLAVLAGLWIVRRHDEKRSRDQPHQS